jgi:hypothetical protein
VYFVEIETPVTVPETYQGKQQTHFSAPYDRTKVSSNKSLPY